MQARFLVKVLPRKAQVVAEAIVGRQRGRPQAAVFGTPNEFTRLVGGAQRGAQVVVVEVGVGGLRRVACCALNGGFDEDGVGAPLAVGLPAVLGGDLALGVGFGDQPFVAVEVVDALWCGQGLTCVVTV